MKLAQSTSGRQQKNDNQQESRLIRRFRVAISESHAQKSAGMPRITNTQTGSRAAGRWFLAGIGMTIALLGVLFVWLMGRSYLRAREMRSWPEAPCVILSSEIEERLHDPQSPREYRLNVSFGYEWKGQPKTGDHLSLRGSPWSSKRELAEKRAAEFPSGTSTTCRIDPKNPDFAVLKPDSLAPGYSIWFPGLFVVGGLGIAARAMVSGKQTR